MKIEFCLAESGDIVFTKESKELKDVINVITKVGTEINLILGKGDFIHGFVKSVMYQVDAENNDESIMIYFTNDYKKPIHIEKIESAKLEVAKINNVLN